MGWLLGHHAAEYESGSRIWQAALDSSALGERAAKRLVADRTVVEIEAYGLPDAALERVRASPGVTSVSVEEREHVQLLLVQAPKGLELTQQLLACLGDVRVGRVAAREPTLEDAYVSLVTGS